MYIYASGKEALDSQHCKCWESYVWRGASTSNRGKDPNTFCSADTVAEDAMFSIWAWNWKLHPSRSSYWQIFRRDVLHYVSSKQKERKQQPQTTTAERTPEVSWVYALQPDLHPSPGILQILFFLQEGARPSALRRRADAFSSSSTNLHDGSIL